MYSLSHCIIIMSVWYCIMCKVYMLNVQILIITSDFVAWFRLYLFRNVWQGSKGQTFQRVRCYGDVRRHGDRCRRGRSQSPSIGAALHYRSDVALSGEWAEARREKN